MIENDVRGEQTVANARMGIVEIRLYGSGGQLGSWRIFKGIHPLCPPRFKLRHCQLSTSFRLVLRTFRWFWCPSKFSDSACPGNGESRNTCSPTLVSRKRLSTCVVVIGPPCLTLPATLLL